MTRIKLSALSFKKLYSPVIEFGRMRNIVSRVLQALFPFLQLKQFKPGMENLYGFEISLLCNQPNTGSVIDIQHKE
jgi:hypothetical protein